MKITIYELLGMIKNGKAPKKIKYKNKLYYLQHYCNGEMDYTNEDYLDEIYHLFNEAKVNDEVEILEEEKKMPEKIKSNGKEFYCDNIDSWIDKEKTSAYCEYLMNKYNDLIDYLKSKGE